MSQLQRLLNSFVTTITEYHQRKLGADAERKSVADLVAASHERMMDELSKYATDATEKDKTRRPLLFYILYGIDRLKYLIDNTEPVEDDAIELIKTQLVELIGNLQILMKTSHSTSITIHYNNKDVQLSGFLRGIISGWALCVSGDILSRAVFPRLELTPEADLETIQKNINTIIDEHFRTIHLYHRIVELEAELESTKTAEATQPLNDKKTAPSVATAPEVPLQRYTPFQRGSIFFPPYPNGRIFALNQMTQALVGTPKTTPFHSPID